ncbi:MAG: disulfide bond formation protein DsbA [Sphingomonas bacterium]|jgi:protein-disulfide isomerase|uniref:DsbA family protein n=1 Tax=Sphingomonas bacterium TaxID=1895847 RepID=UPI00260B50B6|nr:DsbA family protein [Sphingomonas bacterium]MDB5705905.1 disulfide bond formation protein DsbA [Sphingomonas bacterium]
MTDRFSKNPLALAALALVAALIGAGAFWLFQRAVPGALADTDRARVGRVVHEYILDHPEILLEAQQRLQERQVAAQQSEALKVVAANKRAILEPIGSAWAGNPQGDVTVVEYFDYNCGYCRASLPTIDALIAGDPKVKVVFREWPILSDESIAAARVSLAAADQGKFKTFHDALYKAGPVTGETISAAAKAAGIDMARANAFAPQAQAEIASNMDLARKMGLSGTPSWVIGDRVVSTALPLEELQKAVAAARAKL